MIKRLTSCLIATSALTGIADVAHAQASPSAFTSATRYDNAGRVTGTISPNDAPRGYPDYLATRTTYDSAGRPIKVENGHLSGWQSEAVTPASWAGFSVQTSVETTYNAQNQKLTERVKGTDLSTYSLTQYSYDSSGRLECTAVRMNPAIYGSLPASACTMGTQGSDGPDRITRNYYDAAGQLVQVREGVGAGSTIEAAEVTYGYTNNGKIQYVVDAGGHKALMCYDGYDRKTRWVFPSTTNPGSFNDATAALALSTAGAVNGACTGSSGDYEEYGYDTKGNRTSLRKRDGQTLTYQYDFLNRNTVKVVPGSTTHTRDVYYSYDLRGLMTSARFDSTSGEGVTIGYDGFGRKTSETLTMDSVSRTMTSQFDANGNRTRLTWPDSNYVNYNRDGLNRLYYSDNGVIPTFYTPFDAVGRLAAVYPWNPAVGWDNPTGYSYDVVSRLSVLVLYLAGTSYDSTTSLSYNPANQKASVTRSNDAYAFNGYANVNRGYTANGLNQYSNVGGTGFGYDANGNLTSDGANGFAYDVENRLITRSGGASATLRYDPLGRLYEATGSSGTRRFVYDGDALVAEYNTAGTLLRSYVHGTSAGDDPLVWFEGTGVSTSSPRYLYADERGSIVAVTDSAGNVTNLNTYDEYGIPGSGNAGAFQYTGQVWLPELGMYYYKARIYSPTLGRFMQTDPIGYDDQFNLYAYVGNDPVNSIDPTGKQHDAAFDRMAKGLNKINERRTPTGSIIPRVTARQATSAGKGVAETSGVAAAAAGQAPARVTVDNRLTVRTGGAAGRPFYGNQSRRAASVASVGRTVGAVAAPMAAGLDAAEQVQDGKPVDQAIVNAGSRGTFGMVVGGVAAAAAPETAGGSLLVAGVVLAADAYLGGAVGDTAESLYTAARDAPPPDEMPVNP